MTTELDTWREDTPGCAHRVHLNNAGAALMPRSVLEAQRRHIDREGEIGGYEASDEASERGEEVYGALARLLGARASNIAVVENATVGFFQALSAIPWERGDLIVTTRNDYISNQLSFLSLRERFHVEVARAQDLPEGGCDPDSVRELLRHPRARLLTVTWIPTNSGLVQPVEALGALAEQAGVPYLVDACQAVGQIEVDVARIRCDFLSGTARKFLRGPRGIGFLYVSERALRRGDHPLLVDMRGADWVGEDAFALARDARRFENWEFPYALVLGLGEAARYALGVGVGKGGARARSLAERLRESLRGHGLQVLDRGREKAALVTLVVPGWDADALVSRLRAEGINTSATTRKDALIDMTEKGVETALRVSPHYYNTEEELDRLVEAVLAHARRPPG
jgi:selenocysteine lyase/cysteine desulfurase